MGRRIRVYVLLTVIILFSFSLYLSGCSDDLLKEVKDKVAEYNAATLQPDINIKQADNDIFPGSGSHNYGDVLLYSTEPVQFTIENLGTADLILETIETDRVTISGTHSAMFVVKSFPQPVIEPGNTSTFEVDFTPESEGLLEAVVSVPNSDPDQNESPYLFTIQGTGTTTGTVSAPFFTPVQGTYDNDQAVTIQSSTSGSTIRYTDDGSTPTAGPSGHGTIYSSPVSVTQSQTLKAIAYKSGLSDSAVSTAVFTLEAAAPTANPSGGTFNNNQSVTLQTATTGASIRYTTDGSTPTESQGTLYSGSFTVSGTTTLKAIAYKTGYENSTVNTENYTMVTATPTFSHSTGTYYNDFTLTLQCTTSGATIRYTTDGSSPTPTHGTIYGGGFTVSTSQTVKAIAYKSGYSNSSVSSSTYTLRAATPTFSANTGTYYNAFSVTIQTTTSGATIRYTLDGSTPSTTNGTVYSGAVAIDRTRTLKAIAYKSGYNNSSVRSATYTMRVANPSFSPNGSTYTIPAGGSGLNVSISTTTSGASIRYTVDGSTPTTSSGTVYSGSFSLKGCTTMKAIAYRSGWTSSSVSTSSPFHIYHTVDSDLSKGDSASMTIVPDASGDDIYISYMDHTNYNLMMAKSTNGGDAWSLYNVDTNNIRNMAWNTSIAVSGSYVYISYFDLNTSSLKFARSTNGGSSWSRWTLVSGGGMYSSLGVNGSHLYLSYYDSTNKDLKFIKSTDYGASWGTPVTLDSAGDVGQFTSLANIGDDIYISYHDTTNEDLKLGKSTNGGTSWSTSIVASTGKHGLYNSIDVSSSGPTIYISFADDSNNWLRYAKSTNGGTSWAIRDGVVDNDGTAGSSGVGDWTSVAIGASTSYVYISYLDTNTYDLKVARTTNGGTTWTTQTSHNPNNSGQHTSIAVNGSNVYVSFQYDTYADLMFIRSLDGGTTW